ncbi:hypothetical protein [Halofilum ochraceum]|uniref:hypothetical protein n=1 Tax=Halofilum ochraceum TaxID=1611323 RepID=UPI0011131927|nr:hypothetical protein [Halofilum ochraceum]
MARHEFPEKTKRTIAERAGGRCSFPGCDQQCWVPNSDTDKSTSVGVAAHIHAASPGGPRYDPDQSPEQRKSADNAIFLCQDHAHLIDADFSVYSAETLREWKARHEKQIAGEVEEAFALPAIEVYRQSGISIDASLPKKVTQEIIAGLVEHRIVVRNSTDYEYRRIGFKLQYPELLGRFLNIQGPAGFDGQAIFEQDNVRINVTGSGSVTLPGNDFVGSVIVEGKNMLPNDSITLDIPSLADHTGLAPPRADEGDPKYYFWIHGEVTVTLSNVLKQLKFSAPLFYDDAHRRITAGSVHASRPEHDPYITLLTF